MSVGPARLTRNSLRHQTNKPDLHSSARSPPVPAGKVRLSFRQSPEIFSAGGPYLSSAMVHSDDLDKLSAVSVRGTAVVDVLRVYRYGMPG